MENSKIYVFLSASNEVKPAITCKACSANTVVNPLEMPTTVHLIRGATDVDAVNKLKVLVPNSIAKSVGTWMLNDLLKLWEVNTEVSAPVPVPVTVEQAPAKKGKSKREYYKEFKKDMLGAGEHVLSTEERVVLNKILDIVKL